MKAKAKAGSAPFTGTLTYQSEVDGVVCDLEVSLTGVPGSASARTATSIRNHGHGRV